MRARVLILFLTFSGFTLSQVNAHQGCQLLLKNIQKSATYKDVAGRKILAQKCLTAAHEADPSAPGYLKEIETTYRFVNNTEGSLVAQSVYHDALAATATRSQELVHLELLLSFGYVLIEKHQEVQASRIYLQALSLVQTMPHQPPFYGCVLLALAALNEKMGLPIEAEKFYRLAAAIPPYPGTSFRLPQMFSNMSGEMRKDEEDFELALTGFLTRSRRYEEAEQIHKDRVENATGVEKAARLRDYIMFLKGIDDRTADAIPLFQKMLAITQQDRENDRSQYQADLYAYADVLLRSGDLEQAGKVIDDDIATADSTTLPAARSQKVYWLRMKGDEAGANQLQTTFGGLSRPFEGNFDPRSIKARQLISNILRLIGEGEVEAAHRDLDELWPFVESGQPVVRARNIDEIAAAFGKANRQEEGAEVLKQHLAILERSSGSEAPELVYTLLGLACSAQKTLGNSQLEFSLLDRASALAITLDGEESEEMENVYRSRRWALVDDHNEMAASTQADKLLNLSARLHGASSKNFLEERVWVTLPRHRLECR